jgi:hypothetical protein
MHVSYVTGTAFGLARSTFLKQSAENASYSPSDYLLSGRGDLSNSVLSTMDPLLGRFRRRRSLMFTQSVTDLDEFRTVIRPADTEVIVTGGGDFAASLTRVDLNCLWMQRVQEDQPRLMHGVVDRKRASFVFITHPEHGMVWNGMEALYGGMILAAPGGDFCQRLPSPSMGQYVAIRRRFG